MTSPRQAGRPRLPDAERRFWARFGARVEEKQHLGSATREDLAELLRRAADHQEDWSLETCVRLGLFDAAWSVQQRADIRPGQTDSHDSQRWTDYASWLLGATPPGPSPAAPAEPHRWRAFALLEHRAILGDARARSLLFAAAKPHPGQRGARPTTLAGVTRHAVPARPVPPRVVDKRRHRWLQAGDREAAIDCLDGLVASGNIETCDLLGSIVRDASDPCRGYALEALVDAIFEWAANRHRGIAERILETCLYVARAPWEPYFALKRRALNTLANFAHNRDLPWILEGLLAVARDRRNPYRSVAVEELGLPARDGEPRLLDFLREVALDEEEDEVLRRYAILALGEAAGHGHEVAIDALSTIAGDSSVPHWPWELEVVAQKSLRWAKYQRAAEERWRDVIEEVEGLRRSARAAAPVPAGSYP